MSTGRKRQHTGTIRNPATRTKMATSLPNLLTYFRIAMVPAVVACFYFEGDAARWWALSIFILAGITDFFDGYLARAWAQQSNLGRMLDPIATNCSSPPCFCADPSGHDRGFLALGRARHSLPRDSRLGSARISCRGSRERARDAARQMEDDDPDGRARFPACRSRR